MIQLQYQELKYPKEMEDNTQKREYFKAIIQFRGKLTYMKKEEIEKVDGIREPETIYKVVVKGEKIPIHFKAKDKVFIFGKETRIQAVDKVIPEAHLLKVSKNHRLFDRYAEIEITLK